MNDVVLAEAEHAPKFLPQLEAPREARLRSVGVDRLALSDANDVLFFARTGDVRRDYVDMVAVPARFAREEMHVLTDAAEVRIVVLRHQRDAQRTRVLMARHRERSRRHQLDSARARKLTRQERHVRRLGARLEL